MSLIIAEQFSFNSDDISRIDLYYLEGPDTVVREVW